jgi:hypothetical protein
MGLALPALAPPVLAPPVLALPALVRLAGGRRGGAGGGVDLPDSAAIQGLGVRQAEGLGAVLVLMGAAPIDVSGSRRARAAFLCYGLAPLAPSQRRCRS